MASRWVFDRAGSTQTLAIEHVRNGGAAPARFVARRQTDGRGRLDRPWVSPDGGLYVSFVVEPPARATGLVPLAVGTLLARALADRYGIAPRLKWPNDLLVGAPGTPPRKLAGILVDLVQGPSGPRLVIGVGVNVRDVRPELPREIADRTASLAEFVPTPPPLDEVEALVAESVERSMAELSSPEGVTRLLAECRAVLYGVGRRATVDGRAAGTIRSVGEDGALWLEDGLRPVVVRAGDVAVVEES